MKVIIQKWGRGNLPDGFSVHKSESDRIAFIQEYNESLPADASEYSKPNGTPYPHIPDVGEELALSLLAMSPETLKFGWRIHDNNYPGIGGFDGWINVNSRRTQTMSGIIREGRREAYVPQKGYFVLSTGSDGPHFTFLTKEELEEKLKEKYWGEETEIVTDSSQIHLESGHDKMLIIKGETIKPAQVEVVIKYEVP